MPSVQFLAIWTVASQLGVTDQEALSRALLRAPVGGAEDHEPQVQRILQAARKLPAQEQAQLCDFLIGAIEAHYAGEPGA